MDDTFALEEKVREIIKEFPTQVAEYKKGKVNVIQFLLGKTMAKTKGKANPNIAKEILTKLLK
jgi:aspartyl-tRNA(Asn)/glutamyl-tRNA(Gln) amidotransferase subunit B